MILLNHSMASAGYFLEHFFVYLHALSRLVLLILPILFLVVLSNLYCGLCWKLVLCSLLALYGIYRPSTCGYFWGFIVDVIFHLFNFILFTYLLFSKYNSFLYECLSTLYTSWYNFMVIGMFILNTNLKNINPRLNTEFKKKQL